MTTLNSRTLNQIITLGALTGVRSMAGLAALAAQRGGLAQRASGLALAAEMMADKTSLVGDRIDPLPLLGRAVIGATVGALIAREQGREHTLAGTICGAACAVGGAHLAYQVRTRLPFSNIAGGLLEDSLVLAVAYGSRFSPVRQSPSR